MVWGRKQSPPDKHRWNQDVAVPPVCLSLTRVSVMHPHPLPGHLVPNLTRPAASRGQCPPGLRRPAGRPPGSLRRALLPLAAPHLWGMPPGPGGCIDTSTFFRDFLETRDEVSNSMFSLGTDTDASTAREHALLGTIRALLLALLFVGMVGMGSELVLLGHYEDTVQLLPVLLLVAGLVVVLW